MCVTHTCYICVVPPCGVVVVCVVLDYCTSVLYLTCSKRDKGYVAALTVLMSEDSSRERDVSTTGHTRLNGVVCVGRH